MGFRNPITTATAVDTRPGGAGVRLYEREIAPEVFQGVAEWSDGVATATATLTGGGAGDSGGAVFALAGPTVQDTTAPRLSLNVEEAAAFGYRPAARITAPFEPISVGYPAWRTGWRDYPVAGWERPRFTQHADGSVLFAGILQNNTGASQGGIDSDVQIGTIPAGFAPATTCLLDGIGQSGVRYRIDLKADGTIHLGDSPALVSAGYLAVRGVYRLDSTPT